MESVRQWIGKFSQKQANTSRAYGTFFGVFLPSSLSIFGVIMYLRLGLIIGQTGLVTSLIIVLFSSLITLLAALSISSIATNMKVDKGGAYYIISRSLGIDFGSAVGIPLYLAQTIGIAFFVMGFSETFCTLFTQCDPKMVSLISLGILGILCFVSTSLVLKTQLIIFLAIIASLASLFLGHSPVPPAETVQVLPKLGFWAAFAIFFPAVTGIEAGISMSGVLKNPRRSLPIGTLASIGLGVIVYVGLVLYLWFQVPREALATNSMICQEVAKWKWLIIAGIFGATLSSALGGILGAPRTLQAIAEDGVVFRFLGREQGANKEPRIATVFTLVVAAFFVAVGSIDMIAPVLTMFFLITYGMLNLVCGLESLMSNPSWRPTFGVPAWASFTGAILCVVAMLMINPGATMMALVAVSLIYFFRGRKLSASWDDICFGILMLFIKTTVYRLKSSGFAARSWRPHLLVFAPAKCLSRPLVNFATRVTRGNSFLTFATVVQPNSPYNRETVEKSFTSSLKELKTQAFVNVNEAEKADDGYKRLILSHGFGPLTHNTIVLLNQGSGYENDLHPEIIQHCYKIGKNVIVLHGLDDEAAKEKQIDLWWDSDNRRTSELLLVLAHMYQSSVGVKKSTVTIKAIVHNETAREQRLKYFTEHYEKSRLNLNYKIYVSSKEEEFKMISYFSEDADLVFMGLPPPKIEDTTDSYKQTYHHYVKELKHIKKLALVVASEPVNFEELFR